MAHVELQVVHLHLRLVLDETVARRAIPAGFNRCAARRVYRRFSSNMPRAPMGEQPQRSRELHAFCRQLVGGPRRPLDVGPRHQKRIAFEPLQALGQDVGCNPRDFV